MGRNIHPMGRQHEQNAGIQSEFLLNRNKGSRSGRLMLQIECEG